MISRISTRVWLIASFALAALGVCVIAFLLYRATLRSLASARAVSHTREVISALEETVNLIQSAETSQRGYLITGQESYADEARAAQTKVDHTLNWLTGLLAEDQRQTARLAMLRLAVGRKLADVNALLQLRKNAGFDAARERLAAGTGKSSMDRVRLVIGEMRGEELRLLAQRSATSNAEARWSLQTVGIGVAFGVLLLLGILALILRDLRREQTLRTALSIARDEALRTAETRSQFLSRMSHQVRTPLNAILGFNGLLLTSGNLPPRERELAETVRDSGDVLLTIVNEILDVTKIQTGQLTIEPVDFDLRETVESVLALYSELAQSKGLEIGLLWDHELPVMVRGDAARLRQILMNLVLNAVKFTDRGDVIVFANREGRQPFVRFSVTDTGIGLSRRDQERLLAPGIHNEIGSTTPDSGTGLGLFIARDLAALLGGEIGVESELGRGSTFWFSIPLDEPINQMPFDEVSRDATAIAGLRVLVVDDAPANRRTIRQDLSAWKMVSDEAADAEEALAKMRSAVAQGRRFDVALIDSVMPVVDGAVLSRLIKSDLRIASTKIILLTGVSERVEHGKILSLGIEATLTKPARQSALYDVIVNAVSEHAIDKQKKRAPSAPREKRTDVRLLVAEDNSVNQRLARLQLESLGFHSDIVADGAEALEAIGRVPYDLILMDCQMPVLDGFDATRELRRRERAGQRVPVIAMTANALGPDRQKCLDAGMDDYLSKPVDVDQLGLVIDRWLPDQQEDPLDQIVLASLQKLAANDLEVIAELVGLFAHDSGTRIVEIQESIDGRDFHGLAASAHALKSSSGSIGARAVRELAASLEALGKELTVGGAQKLLDQLRGEQVRAMKKLNDLANTRFSNGGVSV